MSGRKKNKSKTRIAIFASGAGSNAEKIIQYFKTHKTVEVALLVCNKPGAGVLSIASANGIESLLIEKERFFYGDSYLPELKQKKIDVLVLAGFLWKVPSVIIKEWRGKIINIHPALLPSYGGKGMYGNKVHEAVIAAGEKERGIKIHEVEELYENGNIIFQARCDVDENETPESLAKKIHALEHAHFPVELERYILK